MPVRLWSAEGELVWQANADAWGKCAPEGDVHQPIRLPGQFEDELTGLYNNRFRDYDPSTGRYLTPDPIGLKGGLNSYRYTKNPVDYVDPLGLENKAVVTAQNADAGEEAALSESSPEMAELQLGEPFMGFMGPVPVVGTAAATTTATATAGAKAAATVSVSTMVAGLATFVGGMLYSPSLGGGLEEITAEDGTVYSKHGDERTWNANGANGAQWQTEDPQLDMEYRTWLANGGKGSFEDWVSEGKPEIPEKSGNAPLSQVKIDEIVAMPKGERPPPGDYLSEEYQEEILSQFDEGASRFMTKGNMEKYGPAQRDGTSFVMPKAEADELIRSTGGDKRKLEDALGLPENFLDDNELVRVDIPEPRSLNLRIPSGNEAGANDLWIPGGKLPDGNTEAVVDLGGISPSKYTSLPLKL